MFSQSVCTVGHQNILLET